jgi:transaldolase
MNSLEQLKKFTTVVADTGDFESMEKYKPQDATTNPSLIYQAAQNPKYKHLVDDAISYAKSLGFEGDKLMSACIMKLAVNFGLEILKIVPGRVSTEVDARLSFRLNDTLDYARNLINLYEKEGITKERILIKVASTWEGIKAAEILEKEGIHTNLTLLFSKCQAIACAEAGIQLISPFVGRILDWYKKNNNVESYPATEDPGVLSVTEIYNYYKKHGFTTEIMGASFRNKEEIIELSGCDLLTISPSLLKELEESEIEISPRLTFESAKIANLEKIEMDENTFRWMMNEDAMATDKLAEGIRNFSKDLVKLENFVKELF